MNLPLLALLAWAAVTDVRARRIPNWISFSLILTGILCAAFSSNGISLRQSALGLLEGIGIGALLLALGVWAAGDAKLLAGIGAWLGPVPLLAVFAVAAVVSMVLAIAISIARGRLGWFVREGMLLGATIGTGGRARMPTTGGSDPDAKLKGIPLAVSFLVATATVLAMSLIRQVSK